MNAIDSLGGDEKPILDGEISLRDDEGKKKTEVAQ
jgi:hypothetical protein